MLFALAISAPGRALRHEFAQLGRARQANCDRSRAVNETDRRFTDEKAITDILGDWRRRLRGSPDPRPRQGGRGRRERSLTRALLEAASARQHSTDDAEALGKLAMIAALYGASQPRERLDPGALCDELSHLREAVWGYLRRQQLPSELAAERILAFDRALSVALRAALTGGYRCADGLGELQQELPPIAPGTVSPPQLRRDNR